MLVTHTAVICACAHVTGISSAVVRLSDMTGVQE
jgi:hypothetical protein